MDVSNLRKYSKIWWKMTTMSFQATLTNRFATILLLIGKVLRFVFTLVFLVFLASKAKTFADYNGYQIIFFFLTFNLIDMITQLFLRGVYYFRPLIVTGSFDLVLLKPLNPLFTSLFSRADFLDLLTLFPFLVYLIFFVLTNPIVSSLPLVFLYVALVICSLMIALALHIVVLAIGILTTEVDHLIWIYRDLSSMGRVPIDIYREWLRGFLTFVIPIGVMMTFPAKALMGLLSLQMVIFSFFLSVIFLFLSFGLWNFALKKYTSASS